MVSTSKPADAPPISAGASATTNRTVARLNARISAYLIDSVVLVAFILVFFVMGGSILLFSSDLGKGDAPDSAYYGSVSLFLGGTLIAWSLFNVALLRWRGQTTGMYVVGIRTVGVAEQRLTGRQALLRWLGLHPSLFHPLLLPVWGVISLLVVSLTLSQAALIVTSALALACLVSPAATLLAVWFDPERRAPHDRLANTVVVHLEQP